jgi:hypothetical protein
MPEIKVEFKGEQGYFVGMGPESMVGREFGGGLDILVK